MIARVMVTAHLHDGPRDGERIGMPWARYELELLRWEGDWLEQTVSDTYRLRAPWRGQETAHFDYVRPAGFWP